MPELPHDQELLDIVNERDEVVGQITHLAAFDWGNLHGNYLRAANVFIINGKGELWIPRRTAAKHIAPSGLDFSTGEHVMSGESYVDAAVRGLAEELNTRVVAADLELFFQLPPQHGLPPYFRYNYLYHSDSEPAFNPDDFVGAEWLAPEAFIKRLRGGDKAKIELLPTVEALLAYHAQSHGHQQRDK